MTAISLISLALSLAPLQAAPTTALGPLPQSINVAGIERCKPATIDRAVDCLTSNLQQDDQRDLARPAGAGYQPAMAQLLTSAWHLDDPTAPLPTEMARRGIYYPNNAASVLMSIMDMHVQGMRIDYKRMSSDLKKTAVVAPAPVAPVTTRTTTITPIAPGAGPSMDGAVAVAPELCKRPNPVPGEIIVSCMKLPNGGLVASRRIPNPPKAPN